MYFPLLLVAHSHMSVMCPCPQRSELGEGGMSIVGGLVARALEQDFATGFRPEDNNSSTQSVYTSSCTLLSCVFNIGNHFF